MRESYPFSKEHVTFSQKVKVFLSNYKVLICLLNSSHQTHSCQLHHSLDDRRRNLYKNQTFLYYPQRFCQDIQKLQLSNHEKELLIRAKDQYCTTHKPDKLKYTDSFTKLMKKRKILPITIDKLKIKGVSQSYLQVLNKSGIQELSFLQQDQKKQLSQIVKTYIDETEFKELNLQIEQTSQIKVQQKGQDYKISNFIT